MKSIKVFAIAAVVAHAVVVVANNISDGLA